MGLLLLLLGSECRTPSVVAHHKYRFDSADAEGKTFNRIRQVGASFHDPSLHSLSTYNSHVAEKEEAEEQASKP